MSDLAARVKDVLEVDQEAFESQVAADAETIKAGIDEGAFDNPQAIIGFEYEFYAVDAASKALARVPRRLLELIGFEKELGLHNAEMCTSPQPLNPYGLVAQEAEVKARLSAAEDRTTAEGMLLVSDAMWTLPPEGETARGYLTASVDDGGVRIASNMSDSPRYHTMANTGQPAAMRLDAPGVSLNADTVMPESLITSIQPHYQVPLARDQPAYFTYALRVAGPLLALGVNSPFFPPDLYEADEGTSADGQNSASSGAYPDPDEILAGTFAENRIGVFETVLNAEGYEDKVAFPDDVETVEEAVDDIAADRTIVPMEVEASNRFDDAFATFREKHGTYWRWVRPVFEGATRSAANARIEFRPIGGQPTVRDSIAFLAAFAGLMESLPRREHPVYDLDWADARENFYGAARDGLDADMVWITNAGDETTDRKEIYEDLFAHIADGLTTRGLSESEAEKYLWPLRQRARNAITPAAWKMGEVERNLTEGMDFAEAVHAMQREYVGQQEQTLIDGSFAEWVGRGATSD